MSAGVKRNHKRGPENHRWKGGRQITKRGYVEVFVDSKDPMIGMAHTRMTSKNGYAFEHRLLMARHLGRVLRRDEEVHHINGKRDDNRLENLQLRTRPHGNGVVLRCQSCGSCDVKAEPLG
jgi:hypothetical protein